MEFEAKKEKLLNQIEKASGISFNVSSSSLSDDELLIRLKDILNHYTVMDNRSSFLRSYVLGSLSQQDIAGAMHKYHFSENSLTMLYLLESTHSFGDDVIPLIKSLLLNPTDEAIEIDSEHILVMEQYSSSPSTYDISQHALELLDILETEAFVPFKISYDKPCSAFSKLPKAYNDIVLSMKIGNIFFSSQRTFCFSELGLGRLLFNVPEEERQAFLDNHIDLEVFKDIDEEILNTLDEFFENDLSIAETARQQFIHRNTLIYRLDKFESLTGLDVRKFSDAITCKVALMLISYMNTN